MEVDDVLPEVASIIPEEPVINTANIKKDILYRVPENIINSNSSRTSTPEKISPVHFHSDEPAEDFMDHQPLSIIIDQGQELRSSKSPDIPLQSLAKVNCPERIVICIDISSEMNEKRYRAKAGTSFSGLDIIKRALKLFVNNKQLISGSNKHSFAIVLLLDQTLWITDFTSTISQIFTQIDSLEALNEQGTTFNMSTLFDLIIEKAKPPILNVVDKASPSYIVRVILIYGRSHCVPVFETHESQNLLTGSPCFFMDIVYLHEPPTDENQSEEIYQELCDLDTRGFSHVFEISKIPTRVFDAFGSLLAHPLQRTVQSQSGFSLEPAPLRPLPEGDDIIGL